ncbi:MAG: ComF family protein [Candidatus Spechtbacterales bacterium]
MQPLTFLTSAREAALDFLFPRRCYGCARWGLYWCAACSSAATLPHARCPHCDARVPFGRLSARCRRELSLTGIFTCASYQTPSLQRLLHDLKFKYAFALAEPLADMAVAWCAQGGYADALARMDMLLPVPSHHRRAKERGFNPAARIAKRVAQRMGIPYRDNVLVKPRATERQVEVATRTKRLENVVGAFAVTDVSAIVGKRVLLVDDVVTTGATLKECARTLRHAGAKEVWALAIAKD